VILIGVRGIEMSVPLLVIGNKNYSSWSLRAWLPLRQFGIAFREERIALFAPGYKARILAYSAAGKVPVLIDGEAHVWDSLAIGEYLADKHPHLRLWPRDPLRRARARSISAEMHAGFAELRARMPMNVRGSYPGKGRTPAAEADIARICALWQDCLARCGGPFLFGEFCLADAMYAPIVSRFVTYAVDLPAGAQAYADRLWDLPAMREWRAAAVAETEVIAEDEPYR
jgi:glutathione S-transferase